MPRIPLIEDLTDGQIPAGSNLLIEFTGASQWYNASVTIAARWLKQEGNVDYNTYAQQPNDIRTGLKRLGLIAEEKERDGNLQIWDYYTATLGQKSTEKLARDSLKVADLSILFSKDLMHEPPQPHVLRIRDNVSNLARFNEEKAWMEYMLTRLLPSHRLRKSTAVIGVLRGAHSGWVYEQLEASVDGIIDFKLDETSDPPSKLDTNQEHAKRWL